MFKIISAILVLFILFELFIVFLVHNYTKIGRYHKEQMPPADQFGYTENNFTTKDGITLCGWFKAQKEFSDKTVILSHGLGASKTDILDVAEIFYKNADVNVFIYDFRAHGKSGGDTSTFGDKEQLDLKAAIEYVSNTYKLESKNIILYGVSMGASVSLLAANEFANVKLIIADSAYQTLNSGLISHAKRLYKLPTRLGSLMVLGYRLRFLNFKTLPAPIKEVGKYKDVKAVFYIHGKRDGRIPYLNSVNLKNNTKVQTKLAIYDTATHIQALSEEPERYILEITAFIGDNL